MTELPKDFGIVNIGIWNLFEIWNFEIGASVRKRHFALIMTLISTLVICSCGTNPGDKGDGHASLAITIEGGKIFNPNIEHGSVDKYRVVIRGDRMDDIAAEFDGGAQEGVIDGIPVGDDREITVEAINPNGLAIRAGEALGVKINSGFNDVPVRLESVPVFANIADGATIENTRLIFRVFSDPAHAIVVDGANDSESFSIVDAATNLNEIHADESTWLASISPKIMPKGEHVFEVRDLSSDRSSSIRVRLIDGERARPAPLVSASSVSNRDSSILFSFSKNISMEVIR